MDNAIFKCSGKAVKDSKKTKCEIQLFDEKLVLCGNFGTENNTLQYNDLRLLNGVFDEKKIGILKKYCVSFIGSKGDPEIHILIRKKKTAETFLAILEENKRKLIAKDEALYKEAIKEIDKNSIRGYTAAIVILNGIKHHKDVCAKISFCEKRIEEIKETEEKKRKNEIYSRATILIKNDKKEDYVGAIKLLETILDWRDSTKLLQKCKIEIEKIEKEEEFQRRETEKRNIITSGDDSEKLQKNMEILKNHSPKIYEPLLSNPYYILGVSCISAKVETLSVQDKIEKFAKLGKSDLYKSAYDLRNIEKPNRNLSNIQSATMEIGEIKHKWFWFISSDYCKLWEFSFLFEELESVDIESPEYYDLFLCCYFKMIVEHADLSSIQNWAKLIEHLDVLIIASKYSKGVNILKSRFNIYELQKYTDIEIIDSFKANILKPINEIVNEATAEQLLEFLTISTLQSSSFKEILKSASERIIACIKDESKIIDRAVDNISDKENPQHEELNEVLKCLNLFKNNTYKKLDIAKKYLNKMYVDRIKSIFRDSIWAALGVYENAKKLKIVLPYATLLYSHCDVDDRRRLRNSFAEYDIDYFDKDFTNEEYIAWGLRYLLGDVVKQDTKRAIRYISGAANRGYVEAQFLYGLCYLEGKGVSQNNRSAKGWLLRAASKEHAAAMFNLCKIYLEEENIAELKKWAIKSAKLGNEDAFGLVKTMIGEGLVSSYDLDMY